MKANPDYFPIFIDLSEQHVVVVGAGNIAGRRIRTILPFAGRLTVIAPEASGEILLLAEQGALKLICTAYDRNLILDADLVLACTNDPVLNGEIYSACKCLGIRVNVCSDRRKCDFYFPGVVRKDEVVIGITASGRNHRKAKAVREKIAGLLEETEE